VKLPFQFHYSSCSIFTGVNAVRSLIVHLWNFVFNSDVSPLRNIQDVAIRHYVLQLLGLMWAIAFALAIGSYTFLAVSLIGHTILIAAAAITVATYTVAAKKPEAFKAISGRDRNGEHN
jgi:hypothetical protein